MSNFEYIIASLPFLTQDYRYAEGKDFNAVIEEIRHSLSHADNRQLDILLQGFDESQLGTGFYAAALENKSAFLREYFRFDLNLRNEKVRFLNQELGRPEGTDILTGQGEEDDDKTDLEGYRFHPGEFDERDAVQEALSRKDLLERERALDDVVWDKISTLTLFDYFDLDAVLGYVAKLHILDRWLSLDEQTGREMFRRLVGEVKGTFQGVDFKDK